MISVLAVNTEDQMDSDRITVTKNSFQLINSLKRMKQEVKKPNLQEMFL